MPKNYLLIYSEQIATEIELICQNIKAPSNTLFQIRKSSSSVYANIREANYGQSKAETSLTARQKRSNFCIPKVTSFLSKPQAWHIITL